MSNNCIITETLPPSPDVEYPMNLLNDIAGHGHDTQWDYPLPSDLSASVEYVLATLPERESMIIHLRYASGLSLREIGDKLGVSHERIRQIVERALCRLSRSNKKDWLIYGVCGIVNKRAEEVRNEKREELIGQQLDGVIKQVTQIANDLSKITGRDEFQLTADEYTKYGFSLNRPITQLGLSTRSENCLMRKKIKTLRDLISLTIVEVKTIRNLGVKSSSEVINKVHSLGLSFADEFVECA